MLNSGPLTAVDGVGDASLIAAVRAGDLASYRVLYERHLGAAQRLARILVPAREVDELVAEAFESVLDDLRNGLGPEGAFRAALLVAMSGTVPNGASTDAFDAMPPELQTALWHHEVEHEKGVLVAAAMGIEPRLIPQAVVRARNQWARSFGRTHEANAGAPDCRATIPQLNDHVLNRLDARAASTVSSHLHSCVTCTMLRAELAQGHADLGGLLAVAFLGTNAAAYRGATPLRRRVGAGLRTVPRPRLPRLRLRALPAIVRAPAGPVVAGVLAATLIAVAGAATLEPSGGPASAAGDQPIAAQASPSPTGTTRWSGDPIGDTVDRSRSERDGKASSASTAPTDEATSDGGSVEDPTRSTDDDPTPSPSSPTPTQPEETTGSEGDADGKLSELADETRDLLTGLLP